MSGSFCDNRKNMFAAPFQRQPLVPLSSRNRPFIHVQQFGKHLRGKKTMEKPMSFTHA
jgi:hypothetical protein